MSKDSRFDSKQNGNNCIQEIYGSDYCQLTACNRTTETWDHLHGLIAILLFIRDSLGLRNDEVIDMDQKSWFGYYNMLSAVAFELELLVERGIQIPIDWERAKQLSTPQ
jgi:hypothetical protein